MNYWLFMVTQQKTDDGLFSADEILEQRLSDRFWGLGEKTPNRRNVKKGDKVVFYVGIPSTIFAASATLASESFSLSEEQKREFGHGKTLYQTDYGVMLENIEQWETPRAVKDLLPVLKYIENKNNWGAYFQGGVRQLTEGDFQAIVENRLMPVIDVADGESEIISQSQFALETHLEDFLDKNWDYIDFGRDLERYREIEGQSGRQFPAGAWRIDFLCREKSKNDLVVIELKRGKTSDSTAGQISRYMAWVEENIAKPGQKVYGIIIAQDVDDALKYAVKGLGNRASLMTYRVNFQLLPFKA